MEQHHKDILVTQRANLVENLNMRDGLFTQMISRKMINSRMMRTMKNGKTEDQQAEELLDLLPKLGSKAFDNFCDALIADFQEPVVTEFLKPVTDTATDSSSSSSSSTSSSSSNGSVSETGSSGVQESSSISTSPSVSDGGGIIPSSSHGHQKDHSSQSKAGSLSGLAVREEYQHQLYRRSIEPGTMLADREIFLAQKTSHIPQYFVKDAEYSFPSAVDNDSRSLYPSLALSKASIGEMSEEEYLSLLSRSPGKAHIDKMVVSDSVLPLRHSKSLQEISESTHYSKPTVFYPSYMASDLASMQPPMLKSQSKLDTFLFEKTGLNSPQHHLSNTSAGSERSIGHYTLGKDIQRAREVIPQSNINIVTQSPSKTAYHQENGNMSHDRNSSGFLERDCSEIPRYREVVHDGNSRDRDMVSFPRHIERQTLPTNPRDWRLAEDRTDGQVRIKENERDTVTMVPKIHRADSVDTMNKRPIIQAEGPMAKRLCAEIIPSKDQASSLPAMVKVYDGIDNRILSIPVIDPPRILPSPATVVVAQDREVTRLQQGSLLGAMDDPEIDLTDGPINVNVELSTRAFYLAHYKNSYAMRNIPRGKALILNVNQVVGKSARRGTDIDRDNLHNLLCQLHFDVTVFNDDDGLTAKEMVLKLQDFSQHPGHRVGDCTVVCILSHGEENYIFGADGRKFELDAVFQLFDNTCCPLLRGKPKIFIVQACRGGALDRGVQYYPDEHDGSDARVRQVPSLSDMVICFPTQNGYYAWRNRDRGSWYVEALVQVFMKYAKCEDLCTMLNRVNLLVSKKVSHCPNMDMDQMSQMSEYKSTLRMPHLFFFPGIGGCPSN